ncbi:Circadian clock protein KaiB [Candidatus Magnetaquicoccaceae bacterium FCR-1]|uniref:Circadian clock protein KaiB n=1 Tax=Candidatus Magnetaquiglobus chichijimensis TaxID=3141448 RepID=A0ABQ0C5C8_9PROT
MSTDTSPRFLLFITGDSPIGQRATTNFRDLAETVYKEQYELEIIDILSQPARAEENNILAAPTLVRLTPSPPVKIIGDLSAEGRVRQILGLPEQPGESPSPSH